MTTCCICRQSPVVWAYLHKCTWTHIRTESRHSNYRTLSKNKHKKAFLQKKRSHTTWGQSLKWYKGCAGLHLWWRWSSLHPQTIHVRPVHPQPAHRKGMSFACKVKFKGWYCCWWQFIISQSSTRVGEKQKVLPFNFFFLKCIFTLSVLHYSKDNGS